MSKLLLGFGIAVAVTTASLAMLAEAQPKPVRPFKPVVQPVPQAPVNVKVNKQAVQPRSRVANCPVPSGAPAQHCMLGDSCVADTKKPQFFNCVPSEKNGQGVKEYQAASTCGLDNLCSFDQYCDGGKCVGTAPRFEKCGAGWCWGSKCNAGVCGNPSVPATAGCTAQGPEMPPCLGYSVCGRNCFIGKSVAPGQTGGGGDFLTTPWSGCDQDQDGHYSVECATTYSNTDDCDDRNPNRYPGNVETCDGSFAETDEDCNPYTIARETNPDPYGDKDNDGLVSRTCSNLFTGTGTPSLTPKKRFDKATNRITGSDCDDTKRGGECP